MGTHVVKVPDVGEGIAEVELVSWSVAAGDRVSRNQILAEVMTDKANVEIPSPLDGVVATIHGKVGERLAVGTSLVELEVAGDVPTRSASPLPPQAPLAESPTPSHAPAPPPALSPARVPAPASPLAMARDAGPPRPEGERPRATPAVRHRARQAGIDLRMVAGTGPAGRITHDDLDAYASLSQAATTRHPANGGPPPGEALIIDAVTATAAATEQPSEPGPVRLRGEPDTSVEDRPIIGVRRLIAERMVASTQSIPHITYVEEVDVTALEELRATLNDSSGPAGPRLTLLPFLIRALVEHMPAHPELNAHVDDERGVLRLFGAVHVGIATQTPNGLVVPVVRHAETQTIWALAESIANLAEAARQLKAAPADLTGSTITITSLGAMGGLVTTPVINKPEVAIIGVNKIAVRPVWIDGAFVPRKIMNLSSSFDHRVIDGWDAASFVQRLRASLEQPALLFVDQP